MVGLFEAREREGAWDVFAGGGVGAGWWLVGVEGAAVVLWGAELVSVMDALEMWIRAEGVLVLD